MSAFIESTAPPAFLLFVSQPHLVPFSAPAVIALSIQGRREWRG